jgi:hypothetical protein
VIRAASAMGLGPPRTVTKDFDRRIYLTLIRRNWHLLPYDQLLTLLGWTEEQLAFTLQEDDFFYIKLGLLKPRCEPVHLVKPDSATAKREAEIGKTVGQRFGTSPLRSKEPLFGFVKRLSSKAPKTKPDNTGPPRFCYSYFAPYGDPLLDTSVDPYPDGLLAKLAALGVNGVWLQGVLYKLAPFPWNPALSTGWETRQANLARLCERAARHGIGIYLYLNEPRAMPVSFFQSRPELRGVVEGDHATLCTSVSDVLNYLSRSVQSVCSAVPKLAGIFTITASENLTNCWSHHRGAECVRCSRVGPAKTVARVNGAIAEGIDRADGKTRLIAWDWGWQDDWAPEAIRLLPEGTSLQSVSEWSLPINRGGVATEVGEYSISVVGPGPRATKHWQAASERGVETFAKVQAGSTWEMSAVPYIPAAYNVALHAARLARSGVSGIMLGWTLGGCPSPNLEVMSQMAKQPHKEGETDEQAAQRVVVRVAERWFGKEHAVQVAEAWRSISEGFAEFPYHGGVVYNSPHQIGPANLLFAERTGYRATMVGIPYDDLDGWRAVYPRPVYAEQMAKTAAAFARASDRLRDLSNRAGSRRRALEEEADLARVCAIHFESAANQAKFVIEREALRSDKGPHSRTAAQTRIRALLRREAELASQLHAIQGRDSRIGFEASNQYYYVPQDLIEKVLNCERLLKTYSN